MIHHIKCWPEYFESIENGIKTFELRKDDRNYKIGDTLVIRDFDPDTATYSGKFLIRIVNYKMSDSLMGLQYGYCILGLSIPIHPKE